MRARKFEAIEIVFDVVARLVACNRIIQHILLKHRSAETATRRVSAHSQVSGLKVRYTL